MGALVYVRCDGPDQAEIRLEHNRRIILHPGEELRLSLARDANFKLSHLDTVVDHGQPAQVFRHVED